MDKPKIKSPHAAALASRLFRKRVKPSGKVYKREKRVKPEG